MKSAVVSPFISAFSAVAMTSNSPTTPTTTAPVRKALATVSATRVALSFLFVAMLAMSVDCVEKTQGTDAAVQALLQITYAMLSAISCGVVSYLFCFLRHLQKRKAYYNKKKTKTTNNQQQIHYDDDVFCDAHERLHCDALNGINDTPRRLAPTASDMMRHFNQRMKEDPGCHSKAWKLICRRNVIKWCALYGKKANPPRATSLKKKKLSWSSALVTSRIEDRRERQSLWDHFDSEKANWRGNVMGNRRANQKDFLRAVSEFGGDRCKVTSLDDTERAALRVEVEQFMIAFQQQPVASTTTATTTNATAEDMDIDGATTWEHRCDELPPVCPKAPSKRQQALEQSSIAPRRLDFECTAPSTVQDIPPACPGAPSKRQPVLQNSSMIMAPRRLVEDQCPGAPSKRQQVLQNSSMMKSATMRPRRRFLKVERPTKTLAYKEMKRLEGLQVVVYEPKDALVVHKSHTAMVVYNPRNVVCESLCRFLFQSTAMVVYAARTLAVCATQSTAQEPIDIEIDDADTWECRCEEIPVCPAAPEKQQQVAKKSMAPRRLDLEDHDRDHCTDIVIFGTFHQRLETQRIETLEAQRIEAQRIETLETQRIETLETQRIETQLIETQRIETQRIETQRIETQRIETQRVETQRIETQRIEIQRIDDIVPSTDNDFAPAFDMEDDNDMEIPSPPTATRPTATRPTATAQPLRRSARIAAINKSKGVTTQPLRRSRRIRTLKRVNYKV